MALLSILTSGHHSGKRTYFYHLYTNIVEAAFVDARLCSPLNLKSLFTNWYKDSKSVSGVYKNGVFWLRCLH